MHPINVRTIIMASPAPFKVEVTLAVTPSVLDGYHLKTKKISVGHPRHQNRFLIDH